jgi:hypothetical protein
VRAARALPFALVAFGLFACAREKAPEKPAPRASASPSAPATSVVASITRGPYVQAVTSTTATLCWTTSVPTDSQLVWPSGPPTRTSDDKALVTTHVLALSGFAPGSRHAYTLSGLDAAFASVATAPAATASGKFTALVFGDSGDGSEHQLQLAKRMEDESFDLVLHTGDVVYPDGNDADYDREFFAPYRKILRSHCFFPAIGNHDLRYSTNGQGEGYRHAFVTFANNPEQSPFYYSFEWGDAKFISLESDRLFKKAGPHLEWLEQELASNTRRWLVVFMHVPLYSPGHHKDSPELIANVGPLLEKYKVDLVLAGHEHLYERLGPTNGCPQILTGGGGAHLDEIERKHPTTLAAESSWHYVLLEFSHDAIRGKTKRIDGTIADDFTLEHR